MYLVVGRGDCPYCEKAKETLDYWQEPYVYVSVANRHYATAWLTSHTGPEALSAKLSMTGWLDLLKGMSLKTVPQVFKLVGGYTELLEEGINDVR